jgi:hypothetical protein
LLGADSKIPAKQTFHFPNGLLDFLSRELENQQTLIPEAFYIQG